jgi:hypothetical protein
MRGAPLNHNPPSIGIIGMILLIGLVKKNGIMLVDFALEGQAHARAWQRGGDPPGLPTAFSAPF